MKTTVVISRSIDNSGPETAVENAVAGFCAAIGVDVLIVPHLYHLPDDSDVWNSLAGSDGHLLLLSWMHPRPAEALLKQHGVRSDLTLNFAAHEDAEACCAAIEAFLPPSGAPTETTEIKTPVTSRWYPIIDVSRCNNCGHCLQFCIFDVFAVDAPDRPTRRPAPDTRHPTPGAVIARNPDDCKPGCPACSRVCPESAIMFPLYLKDDAVAGAPGRFVTPDPSAARRLRPQAEMNKEAMDDIDLLISDLENLAGRRP
jgi:ferredoxin